VAREDGRGGRTLHVARIGDELVEGHRPPRTAACGLGLCHLAKEELGLVHGHVRAQVEAALRHELADPLRQLVALVGAVVPERGCKGVQGGVRGCKGMQGRVRACSLSRFLGAVVPFIAEDHETVVGLTADDAPRTLGGLPGGVEGGHV
jgi:hypothetical protein